VLRRLFPILAFAVFAHAGLFGQAQTAVPGMSRFTEPNFGFSFWYPAAWKMIDEPVADPTDGGWFQNARIVRELQIRNPAAYQGDQPPGVALLELTAPSGLTELGHSRSASGLGEDARYFFDSKTQRWMYAQLSKASNRPPGIYPAEIGQRTMGGLPILGGELRGGAEAIVPLDASHFLAIRTLNYNYDSHNYLAATIVAIGPNAGKLASQPQQEDTIRREGVKLGAIGESIGFWYKDNEHVYDSTGKVLRGADPKTFKPLSDDSAADEFATDGVHVYRAYTGVVPGADPKTFAILGPWTAKDAHHTYDWKSGILRIGTVTAHQ